MPLYLSDAPNERYYFGKDDDGHNYLVPARLRQKFEEARDMGEHDEWEWFNQCFEQYRIDGVNSYTFENPKKE